MTMNHDAARDGAPVQRELQMIVTKLCGSQSCPTVYRSDRGTVVVQGYSVSPAQAGVTVPDGENLVEIPIELLAEAARSVG
ncbi:hypothetical protein [Mangrovihabitans endophyticus]|uniref:Uncharacterized protein n=1 Tax=Mangrovihabitans endophyticus TaxID=1751298 RepID=A0A8J3BWN8_9ACTN|nr:hypothetical protein [Mangrovihabitans endophyticus]GGK85350.1 hypothetical protein GCM10012284_19490 [Mangrovihabitans endophyticus]